MRNTVLAMLALLAAPALGETRLPLPAGSVETFSEFDATGSYDLPIGRFAADRQPSLMLDGQIMTRVFRIPPETGDTLVLLRALRPQLAEQGFKRELFSCATATCGGFDFRIGTRVVPPPAMRFDLTDFRYLALRGTGEPPAHIALLASAGSLQVIEVTPSPPPNIPLEVPAALATPLPPGQAPTAQALALQLEQQGRAVLTGISFATGAKTLAPDQAEALSPVAQMLTAKPELRIVVVGHTDNAGALKANISLSRARAQAVRQTLTDRFDIDPARIEADGVGFLMPLAPNSTDANRALNRRVEIIAR